MSNSSSVTIGGTAISIISSSGFGTLVLKLSLLKRCRPLERHVAWAAQMPADVADLWDFVVGLDHDSRMALFAHCAALTVFAVRIPWDPKPKALTMADALGPGARPRHDGLLVADGAELLRADHEGAHPRRRTRGRFG